MVEVGRWRCEMCGGVGGRGVRWWRCGRWRCEMCGGVGGRGVRCVEVWEVEV